MISHYKKILKDTEKRVLLYIKKQMRDKASPYYGGIISQNNIADPRDNVFILAQFIELYLNKDSIYYKDQLLYERILILINYIKNVQRLDGTFDLTSCNFFSAPDTAFAINRIIPAYRMLRQLKENFDICQGTEKILEEITIIIEHAGYGIMNGGFHTPNHRWAIAACLLTLYNIFKIKSFKDRSYDYLREGIDCNEYGEYAERSSGNYNHVNNEQMIILAEETNDISYLEYVKRNLDMMITYFEPDGTIFTGNSSRQDRGQKIYPDIYYNQYLYMACKYNNSQYASIANWIMNNMIERGAIAPDCLGFLVTRPELVNFEFSDSIVPDIYNRHYKDSGIVRSRRENVCFTLLKDSNNFLYFQVGEVKMGMRIFARHFDNRQFKPEKIKETEDGYLLSYMSCGWYYHPLDEKPETTDWWSMENHKRRLKKGPDLSILIKVKEIDRGIYLEISADGCDGVPIFIQMHFESDVVIKNDGFICEGMDEGAITVSAGNTHINKGADTMIIGPGFGKILISAEQLQEINKSTRGFSLFFSDVSNFKRIITMVEKI